MITCRNGKTCNWFFILILNSVSVKLVTAPKRAFGKVKVVYQSLQPCLSIRIVSAYNIIIANLYTILIVDLYGGHYYTDRIVGEGKRSHHDYPASMSKVVASTN